MTEKILKSHKLFTGEFGEVTYNISGELSNLFTIDSTTGVISVAEGAVIDRENITDVYLRAVASDNAPPQNRKTTSVPVSVPMTIFISMDPISFLAIFSFGSVF